MKVHSLKEMTFAIEIKRIGGIEACLVKSNANFV